MTPAPVRTKSKGGDQQQQRASRFRSSKVRLSCATFGHAGAHSSLRRPCDPPQVRLPEELFHAIIAELDAAGASSTTAELKKELLHVLNSQCTYEQNLRLRRLASVLKRAKERPGKELGHALAHVCMTALFTADSADLHYALASIVGALPSDVTESAFRQFVVEALRDERLFGHVGLAPIVALLDLPMGHAVLRDNFDRLLEATCAHASSLLLLSTPVRDTHFPIILLPTCVLLFGKCATTGLRGP
jgi:hypothetical protein